MTPGLLDGVKVLDFTTAFVGPFCSRIMADMGADVIKVERPITDQSSRLDRPDQFAPEVVKISDGFSYLHLNGGKRSLCVDLKHPRGLEIVRSLLKHVVCPGFVDIHSHAGLTILGPPHHDPKVRQGVTTELVGIDGISHAPFKTREELHRYIWLDSGLNGNPPMPADWLTVADLLSRYDNEVAINIAYILGNSPVRTPIPSFPHRWGRDLFSPPLRGRVRVGVEEDRYHGLSLADEGTYTVGLMFWFSRNRFVGSYLFFRATSLS